MKKNLFLIVGLLSISTVSLAQEAALPLRCLRSIEQKISCNQRAESPESSDQIIECQVQTTGELPDGTVNTVPYIVSKTPAQSDLRRATAVAIAVVLPLGGVLYFADVEILNENQKKAIEEGIARLRETPTCEGYVLGIVDPTPDIKAD